MLQELEVWYVLPAIRKALTEEFFSRGMKQIEISYNLGVTKSAITQYLQGLRGKEFEFPGALKDEVVKSVDSILEGNSPVVEMQRILIILRNKGHICKLHGQLEGVENGCDLCFRKK
jgi:predicted transcriptional regulator